MIPDSRIISSSSITIEYLKQNNLNPLALLDPELLESEEFTSAFPDFDKTDASDDSRNCVLIGLAPEALNYKNLNRAFRLVMDRKKNDKKTPIIAIHAAKFFQDNDDKLSLGPGPFLAALTEATDQQAEIIGKPSEKFFEAIMKQKPDSLPQDYVMIGDDLVADIGGAAKSNVDGVLVRTGKFLDKDESNKRITPAHVCDNFEIASEWVSGKMELPETPIPSPPLSPREVKMAKEIEALKHQVKTVALDDSENKNEDENENKKENENENENELAEQKDKNKDKDKDKDKDDKKEED